jgi:hypothetical protein
MYSKVLVYRELDFASGFGSAQRYAGDLIVTVVVMG